MDAFAIALVKNPKHEGASLPDRFNVYALKVDGAVKGTLAHKYRPKNAGGSAWCVTYRTERTPAGCVGECFWGSKADCLAHFKTIFG